MKELSKAEELVLLTVWKMEGGAYGVAIKRKIKEKTGKDMPYGTLYFLLDQLSFKEFVSKTEGEPTPERGGRRKTYYKITDLGLEALKKAFAAYQIVWGGMSWDSFKRSTG